MQRFAEAVEDFREVLLLEPANKEAQTKLREAQQHVSQGNGSV